MFKLTAKYSFHSMNVTYILEFYSDKENKRLLTYLLVS